MERKILRTTGPFMNDHQGRLFMVHYYRNSRGKMVQTGEPYHRWLLKDAWGIEIRDSDVVHHKDGNPLNNTLENLQVISRTAHTQMHEGTGITMYKFNCPECDEECEIPYKQYKQNQLKMGLNGPYCSTRCSMIARRRREREGK